MKLTLTLKNVIPEIIVRKRDFLGEETEENLSEHRRVSMARACVEARPTQAEYLRLQLEQLPHEVFEVVVRLNVFDKKLVNAEWKLEHDQKFLHGCTYSFAPHVPNGTGVRIFRMEDPHARRDSDATLVFRRTDPHFDDNRRAFARGWTIYNVGKIGFIWDNYKYVSEADPDPRPVG